MLACLGTNCMCPRSTLCLQERGGLVNLPCGVRISLTSGYRLHGYQTSFGSECRAMLVNSKYRESTVPQVWSQVVDCNRYGNKQRNVCVPRNIFLAEAPPVYSTSENTVLNTCCSLLDMVLKIAQQQYSHDV